MHAAYGRARETFRFFWRAQLWEFNRIIPALSLACVKLPFADGKLTDPDAEVEHMWVNEIGFDGKLISGTLINDPNGLKSVKVGDAVKVPVGAISDWMYAVGDDVCGAFTVNLIRSRMAKAEMRSHDGAWGLNFGDPKEERLFPPSKNPPGGKKSGGGFLGKLFGGGGGAAAPIRGESELDVLSETAEPPLCLHIVLKYAAPIGGDTFVLSLIEDRESVVLGKRVEPRGRRII